MLTTNRITWRNGFRLNGEPVFIHDVQDIFEERVSSKKWEIYEQRKAELLTQNLSPDEYQSACRQIAEALGI